MKERRQEKDAQTSRERDLRKRHAERNGCQERDMPRE